jgi:hypothetical protein
MSEHVQERVTVGRRVGDAPGMDEPEGGDGERRSVEEQAAAAERVS